MPAPPRAPPGELEVRCVSTLAEANNLNAEVGQGAEHLVPPSADSIVAATPEAGEAGNEFDVVIHERQKSLEVPTVEGVDDSETRVYVLLRHRPVSISRR